MADAGFVVVDIASGVNSDFAGRARTVFNGEGMVGFSVRATLVE